MPLDSFLCCAESNSNTSSAAAVFMRGQVCLLIAFCTFAEHVQDAEHSAAAVNSYQELSDLLASKPEPIPDLSKPGMLNNDTTIALLVR